MSAHDHFHRQVHGWGPTDFLTEIWHFFAEAAGARLAQIGWLTKKVLDFYYCYWYTDLAILYVLACLLWVLVVPTKPLPRLLDRRAYALATFSVIYHHRLALWAALGPPFTRWPPIVAITAYAYLVFVRVINSQQ